MNFQEVYNKKEFDFSVKCYSTDDLDFFTESEKPKNIEEEIFLLLCDAVLNRGEYRFIGMINKKEYFINKSFKRNGYVWDNILYDDLFDLLNIVANKKHFNRIHNCLEY